MRTVCMDGQCLKKIPVSSSEWVEELSQFKKDFKKKDYDEDSDKGYFLEYPKICLVFIVIYHLYLKEIKLKNVRSLFVKFMTRKTMLFT